MVEKARKQRRAPTGLAAAPQILPAEAVDLTEVATKHFRLRLLDAVEEHLRSVSADRDLQGAMARLAVEAVLEMVGATGEFPLSPPVLAAALQASPLGDEIRIAMVASLTSAEAEDQAWDTLNERRLTLIHRSVDGGLTGEEERELQELQATADRRLEPHDDRLLDGLRRMQQAVEQLPRGS